MGPMILIGKGSGTRTLVGHLRQTARDTTDFASLGAEQDLASVGLALDVSASAFRGFAIW